MTYADPKNALAFYKIFGTDGGVLISFINAFFDFKGDEAIKQIELKEPYSEEKISQIKHQDIMNISAMDKKGQSCLIQILPCEKSKGAPSDVLNELAKKSLYFASNAYAKQSSKCDTSKLKKVYFVGFVNSSIFESKNYISCHCLVNSETKNQDIGEIEFRFVELNKFNKDLSKLSTVLDKWMYFIKNVSQLKLMPDVYTTRDFKNAFNLASLGKWDKQEQEAYNYMVLRDLDDTNAIKNAESKALQKGIEEAKKIVVLNALKQGLDYHTIEMLTGLSDKMIDRIAKGNK